MSDKENFKDKDIKLESYTLKFKELFEKTISLKEMIENEINKINLLYNQVNEKITELYQKKHEDLLKEEEELRKNLEIDVTKVKSDLEKYLSKSVEYIKKDEKINKGLKNLEKEQEINIYKHLNYISKINKINTKMDDLLYTNMTNLKLSLNEKDSMYEEYYFNGIPIPKDIKYNDLFGSREISWQISSSTNIDNNLIIFKVEAKKENEQFIEVYKGKNNYCQLQNLQYGANYEIRISSIYNDLMAFSKETLKININGGGGGGLFRQPNNNLFGRGLFG